jgi:predicted ArsR family transcriptional regulator
MQTMTNDLLRHKALGGTSRSRLLALLTDAGGWVSVHELAGQAGPRANTTRNHLEQLVASGLVERRRTEPKGRGRPAYQYRAKRQVDEAQAYRALASVLADTVAQRDNATISANSAGERWGTTLAELPRDSSAAPVDQLVRLLDDLGFEPSLADAGAVVELHGCPFRSVARAYSDVVCNIHLGLMRGALRGLGSSTEVTSLEPFVTPTLCLAQLRRAEDVAPSPSHVG